MSVHAENGNWRVKWRANGKQRSRTFSEEGDARAFDANRRRRKQISGAGADLRWHASPSWDPRGVGEQFERMLGNLDAEAPEFRSANRRFSPADIQEREKC